MKRKTTVFTLAIAGMFLAGCGQNESSPETVSSPEVKEMETSSWTQFNNHQKSPRYTTGLQFVSENDDSNTTSDPDDALLAEASAFPGSVSEIALIDPWEESTKPVDSAKAPREVDVQGLTQAPDGKIVVGTKNQVVLTYDDDLDLARQSYDSLDVKGVAYSESGLVWTTNGSNQITKSSFNPETGVTEVQSKQDVFDSEGTPIKHLGELEKVPGEDALLVVQDNTNNLFKIDMATGKATQRWNLSDLQDREKREGISDPEDSALSAVAVDPQNPNKIWVTGKYWKNYHTLNLTPEG